MALAAVAVAAAVAQEADQAVAQRVRSLQPLQSPDQAHVVQFSMESLSALLRTRAARRLKAAPRRSLVNQGATTRTLRRGRIWTYSLFAYILPLMPQVIQEPE